MPISEQTCQHCNKTFIPKYKQPVPQRFCSPSCRNKARANPPGTNRWVRIDRICAGCNKPFRPLKSETNRGAGIYCSRKCHDARLTPIQDRFWAKVNKTDTCWLWAGANSEGKGNNPKRKWPYGSLGLGRTKLGNIPAHHFSWELHNAEEVPEGVFVCHTCDVTLCVNPDHLFLGTAADNTKDMLSKNRCKTTKLTEDAVLEIRQLYATGNHTHKSLAKLYNISSGAIGLLLDKKTWKHI